MNQIDFYRENTGKIENKSNKRNQGLPLHLYWYGQFRMLRYQAKKQKRVTKTPNIDVDKPQNSETAKELHL